MGVITLRSDSERRRRATAALQRLRPALTEEAEQVLGRAEAVGFLARLDVWFLDLHGPLEALYGDDGPQPLQGCCCAATAFGVGAQRDHAHILPSRMRPWDVLPDRPCRAGSSVRVTEPSQGVYQQVGEGTGRP